MNTTKMTAVLAAFFVGGSLFGGSFFVEALAQNTSVNTDDDVTVQENKITQKQTTVNVANAGNTIGKDNVVAGNNAAAISFQDQEAVAANINLDDDLFVTEQFDICAFVDVAFIC
jgi:hypothetical protein